MNRREAFTGRRWFVRLKRAVLWLVLGVMRVMGPLQPDPGLKAAQSGGSLKITIRARAGTRRGCVDGPFRVMIRELDSALRRD